MNIMSHPVPAVPTLPNTSSMAFRDGTPPAKHVAKGTETSSRAGTPSSQSRSNVEKRNTSPLAPSSARGTPTTNSKWSAEEDALLVRLRGKGMIWDDISKFLQGRTSMSCRLHYQNYLERRAEWSEEKKSELARRYER